MGKLFENFEPYDVQATRREARAAGREEGRLEGRAEGRLEGRLEDKAEAVLMLLEEIGEVPDELRQTILNETDMEVLNSWLKLAARTETIEAFRRKAGI